MSENKSSATKEMCTVQDSEQVSTQKETGASRRKGDGEAVRGQYSQKAMTVEKGLRATSPVHVHVEDDVPVHVHLKQPKSKGLSKGRLGLTTGNARSSRPRRTTVSSRAKSKSPSSGPWVPPPGKASRSQKISWQGPTHRLEINTPRDGLRLSDLSTEEEDQVHGQMKNYEKKIDSLMTEMGTLRNEAELQRAMRQMERKEEMLDASRRVMEEQERELFEYKEELTVTEKENKILRKSMDLLQDEADLSMTEKELMSSEREDLMKKLIEVEMDGQAASSHIRDLKDLLRRLRDENRVSFSDTNRLAKQKDLLLEKLADFESTNRTLRRLLREQHRQEAVQLRLGEHRDTLMKKLAEGDRINEKFKLELRDKERDIIDLKHDIASQREANLQLSGIQGSLENTRAHLQKELRTKEGDCNRMAVQIRSLESQLAQSKIDVGHYRELVSNAKEKAERDKEALKKATRVQKQRAARSEDAVEQLSSQLLERDTLTEELRSRLDQSLAAFDKVAKERSQFEAENSALNTRLEQLEHIMNQTEHSAKGQVELLTTQLHEQTSDSSQLKLENERLKSSVAAIESKFQQADGELVQLRDNLKQYENLVGDYRDQMNRSRREADDTLVRLDEQEKEKNRLQLDGELELEKVKLRLHQRLQELEPLPEMLKETELKLHENQEQLIHYQKQNSENTKLIADLTTKVEVITSSLEQMKSKLHLSRDENQHLNGRIETFEKKFRDADGENRDLMAKLAHLEEKLHQNNLRLEEKGRENTSLTRQLENALTDVRRLQDQARDTTAQKERTFQTRILDLESQLSQCRAETAKIKREKEENERKFNSKLYDLKDRLEQSHSTNRSMQNYVQFLKNSYANVFGDNSMGLSSSPMRSAYP
ncbi:hypothetical protein ScPMuIL_011022 [Solemya velum]